MELKKLDLPFNAQKYRDLLNDVMYPAARLRFPVDKYPVITFMHDNSPVHTAAIINEWFVQHPDVQLLSHPPYSPDLNPIENIRSKFYKYFIIFQKKFIVKLYTTRIKFRFNE